MEVKIEYKSKAKCHPSDLWHIFKSIEEWQNISEVFGEAGWVHGSPWQSGSRFFTELRYPKRMDLEVLVQKCIPEKEVVLLSHGSGFASEQWIRFVADGAHETIIESNEAIVSASLKPELEVRVPMLKFFERWFDGLAMEAERHCTLVAL